MGGPSHPPAIAFRLLRWFCQEHWIEEIEGDLIEYYELYRAKHPGWKVKIFFWFHLISLIRPYNIRKRQNSIPFSMYQAQLRFAWRYLVRHRSQTLTNLLSLSIGVASFLILFIYVDGELSYDRFHDDADLIYRVPVDFLVDGERIPDATVPPALNKALKENLPQVAAATRLFPGWGSKFSVRVNEQHAFVETEVLRVDPEFFDVFGFHLLSQSDPSPLSDPSSVILTERTAKKYFGEENPLGRELIFEGMDPERRTVTGIIENVPFNSHFTFDILLKLHNTSRNLDEDWGWYNYYQYIKVKERADVSSLDEQMQEVYDEFNTREQEDEEKNIVYAQSLGDIHLTSQLKWELGDNNNLMTIRIITLLGIFILLISLINYVNLTSAQLLSRVKEVGVRKSFGARGTSLIAQFLFESILLTIIAIATGAGIAQLIFELSPDLFGRNIYLVDQIGTLGILSLVVVLVAFLATIRPAMRFSSLGKGPLRSRTGLLNTQNLLLVVQFTASSIIIVGTLVVLNQMSFFREADKGFNSQLLVIENARTIQQQDALLDELLALPSIEAAGYTSGLPGVLNWTTMIGYPNAFQMSYALIGPSYLEAAGFQLLAGRNFREGNESDMSEMHFIINEAAAKALDFDHNDLGVSIPIATDGDSIQYGKVLGVVKNFHFTDFKTKIKPFAFFYRPGQRQNLVLNVQSSNMHQALSAIEGIWDSFSNGIPATNYFLERKFDQLHVREARLSRILTILCILSLFLSFTGMLGIVNFLIRRRLKEIALRKALGASLLQVVQYFTKNFLVLVLIGNGIGLPLAYAAMNEWLDDFSYRIPLSPMYFGIALLATLALAALLVGTRSVVTTRTNLIDRLREE
ncbi:MAG: ABC transporter permease [Bacteroidota bacterium]